MIIRAAAPFFFIKHFIFLHVYVEIIVQIARQCIQSKLLFFSNKAFNCLKNTHSTSTQTFKSERKFVHMILQTTFCNSLSFSTSSKIWRYYSSECRFDKAIIKSSWCRIIWYICFSNFRPMINIVWEYLLFLYAISFAISSTRNKEGLK